MLRPIETGCNLKNERWIQLMPISIFQISVHIPNWGLSSLCPVNWLLVPITVISFIIDGSPNAHFHWFQLFEIVKLHIKRQPLKNSLNLE